MAGGAARTVTITGFANFAQIEAAFARMGLVADDSTKTMQGAAAKAGESAAAMAKAAGLSADEQAAAAGRAAAAQVEASSQITRAQKAAADAAATTAKAMGLSADEQDLAAKRAIGAQADVEAKMGASTSRLTALGRSLGTWGVPFSGSIQTMGKRIDETTSKTERFAENLASMGKLTLVAGLAGFAAAAYEGVKGAVALQKQMEMIHTQAGASQAEVTKMTQAVLGLGPSVGTGPQALAEGLYHVESVGMRGAKALDVLKTAAEGAKVGNANLTDVTNALDSAVVSGISGAQNYQKAMGALNATVGSGDMTMQNLADALSTGVLATMKTFGVSLRDTGAALAVFGDNNIRGQEAATKLASAVRIMAAPSAAGAKALAAVNISQMQLANDMRSGGLIKALEDLKTHLTDSGATASQQAAIVTDAFGRRQSTGVLVLLDELDRLKNKYKDVGDGAGHFGDAWGATQKTLSFQFDQLKSSLQSLADRLGTVLIPVIQSLITWISNAVTWFEKHKAVAEALAGVIGGVLSLAVATFVVGKLASLIKSVGTALGAFVKLADWLTGGMITAFRQAGAEGDASVAKIGTTATETASVVESESAQMSLDLEGAGAGAATADTAIVGIGTTATTTAGVVETETAAMGASFTAMLGPIALVAGAIAGLDALSPNFNAQTGSDITKFSGAAGKLGLTSAQLGRLRNTFGKDVEGADWTQTGRRFPWSGDLQSLLGLGTSGLTSFAKTGKESAFDQFNKAAMSLEKEWPQTTSTIKQLTAVIQQAEADSKQNARMSASTGHGAGSVNRAAGFGGAAAFTSSSNWANALLGALGVKSTPGAVTALEDFQAREGPFGTQAAYNPLNVSGPLAGTGKFDGTPAENYGSPQAGIQGEVAYFQRYGPGVIAALKTGNVAAVEAAVRALGPNAFGNDTSTPWAGSGTSVPAGHPSTGVQNFFAGQAATQTAAQIRAADQQTTYTNTVNTVSAALQQAIDKFAVEAKTAHSVGNEPLTVAADKLRTAAETLLTRFRTGAHGISPSDPSGLVALEDSIKSQLASLNNMYASQKQILAYQVTIANKAESQLSKFENLDRQGTVTSIRRATTPAADATFNKLVDELKQTHAAALEKLAEQLVAAHKDALASLHTLLVAAYETALAKQTDAVTQMTTDQTQEIADMAQAIQQQWQDVAQQLGDQLSAQAQSVTDSTTLASDTASASVQAINDQSTITTDTLGERGLYGLNLQAQQQKVALDQITAGWDSTVASLQQNLDSVTAAQNQLVSRSQQNLDAVSTQQHNLVATAQSNLDAVTETQDSAIAVATAQVTAASTGSKTQQATAAANLALVTASAKSAESFASQALQQANQQANATIGQAQAQLTAAQGEASVTVAQAQQTLTASQNNAQTAEATQNAIVQKLQEMANVQYAGSGLTVNIEGIAPTDASAVASAVGWVLRTAVPV